MSTELVPLDGDDDEGRFQVTFGCADECDPDAGVTSATLNGIEVTNGQVVELELDDEEDADFDDGVLEIEAPSFELVVVCEDAPGNVGSATATPRFVTEDDDSDDD